MLIVFYVSGHGFGHASRDIELTNTLTRRRPDVAVRFRTAAPRWLFDVAASGSIGVDAVAADTGVVQIDSLRLDEQATLDRAAAFYATFDERVAAESAWLTQSGARLVLGDIPPLAFAAAADADLPSVALGNFTWDWIYAGYPLFTDEAPALLDTIRGANRQASLALRLPFHGGFDGMNVRDLPLIARRSGRAPAETRAALGIPDDRAVVLASFGGYGAALPTEAVAARDQLTIVETRIEHVDEADRVAAGGRLLRFGEHDLYDRGFRYEDLVAAADLVISKPGYGIVSECIANRTALLYTSRGRFVEYDVFVEEMPRRLRCRYIAQVDLLAGAWEQPVEQLLAQPAPAPPPVDGADVAVDEILRLIA